MTVFFLRARRCRKRFSCAANARLPRGHGSLAQWCHATHVHAAGNQKKTNDINAL